MSENTYNGSCFCGAVQLTVSGEPAAMGYCHCESCRHWSAGPVNAFTLWPPERCRSLRGRRILGRMPRRIIVIASGVRLAAVIYSPSIPAWA